MMSVLPTELMAVFGAGVVIGVLIQERLVHPRLASRARIWRRLRMCTILAALLLAPMGAEATSASVEVVADWAHLTWTASESLVVTRVDVARVDEIASTATSPGALAFASALDGQHALTLAVSGDQRATGSTLSLLDFWLYATGSGTLTVTVPFHVALASALSSPQDRASAFVDLALTFGPGPVGLDHAAFAVSGTDALEADGVLTLAPFFLSAAHGPLLDIALRVEGRAATRVPEPPTWLLLGALPLWLWRRRA